jgi:hypothetical protein
MPVLSFADHYLGQMTKGHKDDLHYIRISVDPPIRHAPTIIHCIQASILQCCGITRARTYVDVLWLSPSGDEYVLRTGKQYVLVCIYHAPLMCDIAMRLSSRRRWSSHLSRMQSASYNPPKRSQTCCTSRQRLLKSSRVWEEQGILKMIVAPWVTRIVVQWTSCRLDRQRRATGASTLSDFDRS